MSIIRTNANLQRQNDAMMENGEEYLLVLATSCDYGQNIILIKSLVAFFTTATFVE